MHPNLRPSLMKKLWTIRTIRARWRCGAAEWWRPWGPLPGSSTAQDTIDAELDKFESTTATSSPSKKSKYQGILPLIANMPSSLSLWCQLQTAYQGIDAIYFTGCKKLIILIPPSNCFAKDSVGPIEHLIYVSERRDCAAHIVQHVSFNLHETMTKVIVSPSFLPLQPGAYLWGHWDTAPLGRRRHPAVQAGAPDWSKGVFNLGRRIKLVFD